MPLKHPSSVILETLSELFRGEIETLSLGSILAWCDTLDISRPSSAVVVSPLLDLCRRKLNTFHIYTMLYEIITYAI